MSLRTLGRRRSPVVGSDAANDAAENAAVLRALRYGTATYTAPSCGAVGDDSSWLYFAIVALVLVVIYIIGRLLERRRARARTSEASEPPAVEHASETSK